MIERLIWALAYACSAAGTAADDVADWMIYQACEARARANRRAALSWGGSAWTSDGDIPF